MDLNRKLQNKAVILVHMLGTPGNLNRIKNICKRKSIILIEEYLD